MSNPQIAGSTLGSSPVPLSVLDLAGVGTGQTVREALESTTALAAAAERWGYTRFWVAEHHGIPAVASAAPPVLLAHLGAATHSIRLGSGGVMLPNHAPLAVAEQFGTLAALHPGRIDLGLGRAPGSDQLTSYALRRRMQNPDEDMADRLTELRHFLRGDFPDNHPFAAIQATPVSPVPVWLLGSSDWSARLAGKLGLPFAFAHHFAGAGGNTLAALDIYRQSFRPSDELDEPYSMIGVSVVAADTEEEAQYQARPGALSMLLLRRGQLQRTPSPEEAAEYPWTQQELDLTAAMQSTEVIGDPQQVAAGLRELVEDFGVQELMVSTRVHGHQAKLRSYELVAEAFRTAPVGV
ncbi:MsnO8 family LLM class oxidoreductase [Nakamurella sp. YIM 132087]|uniref:MsnO8 family LLM class oxidoreductase n=1 Tax=Nakamurella alba TaxID=2665158 RepID=A0A7K1FJR2_9ACTN|nr:LLM class flavin-dependent oxidoreductase [Nakamurella alba]MTD13493.1 MsnO8 family LLM class oxidoreductase [Nakamurella alba]